MSLYDDQVEGHRILQAAATALEARRERIIAVHRAISALRPKRPYQVGGVEWDANVGRRT